MPTAPINGFQSAVTDGLGSVPADDIPDIYALSFYVYDEDDDPRRPTLTVGYNTIGQWRESIPQASSSNEAKWNYAFWLQNEVVVFGDSGTPGAGALARWIAQQGLAYTDADEDTNFDRCLAMGEQITSRFVAAVCELAATLHNDGTVTTIFGRPLPIIVHELEYYDQIADQTERCNPPGRANDFVSWVREGCP